MSEKQINSSVRLPQSMYQAALAIARRNGLTYSAWVKATIAPIIESERSKEKKMLQNNVKMTS